jgi:hypothetical protein
MTWNPLDNAINYAKFAGKKTPGLGMVEGAGSPRAWDERGGYGLSGSTLVFTGLKLSEFTFKIRLYSTQDWNDWHSFKEIVKKPPPRVRPRAIDFWHPFTEDLGIKSVVVLDVSQPEQVDETGVWEISIKLKAYRRPKLTLAKPDGSQAGPVDPIDAMIDRNNNTMQQLLTELSK